MANTHLTVQGTVSFVKHAVCAKVSIDRGSIERTGRATAWQCFWGRWAAEQKGNQHWLRASPALQMGEQVQYVHTREVQVYPAPATHFPEDDPSEGQ